MYKLFWRTIFIGTVNGLSNDFEISGTIALNNLEYLRNQDLLLAEYVYGFGVASPEHTLEDINVDKVDKRVNPAYSSLRDSTEWYQINDQLQKLVVCCPLFHKKASVTIQLNELWLNSARATKHLLFEEEIVFLNKQNETHRRTKMPLEKIVMIEERYPGIPQAYLNYLYEIGNGEVFSQALNFFGGPVTLQDLSLEEDFPDGKQCIFIATEWSGVMVGFDPASDFALIELDPEIGRIKQTGKSFKEMIRELLNRSAT